MPIKEAPAAKGTTESIAEVEKAKVEIAPEPKIEAPKAKVLEATPPPPPPPTHVKCECNAARHQRPGEVVNRWGYSWTVAEDAVRMFAMIPVADVENGVAAGRWVAEGMPEEKRSSLFWLRQYQELFGVPAGRGVTPEEARTMVLAEERRRAGAKLIE